MEGAEIREVRFFLVTGFDLEDLHPRKRTRFLKNDGWKTSFLLCFGPFFWGELLVLGSVNSFKRTKVLGSCRVIEANRSVIFLREQSDSKLRNNTVKHSPRYTIMLVYHVFNIQKA